MRDKMLEYLAGRIFCVISTVDGSGNPEAAFVGYSSSENLEIIIGTSKGSRKYKNILTNSKVAIVVADTTGEVQYEGRASSLSADEYDRLIADGRFKALPGSDKYRQDPTQVWFRIKPTWVRFIDHTVGDQIEEFTEFAS